MNHEQRVIAYVPKEEDDKPASDMGTLRRGLWVYTNKLGLNFSLVLFLSLAYQLFVALFIAFKGMKTLPVLRDLEMAGQSQQILASVAAVLLAIVIQGLIIAEMAQVVWLRHPDRLKVKLMSGSIWWWVMLAALLITMAIDFLLLFLSVTGKSNLGDAWKSAMTDQLTGFTTLLLALLSFLTLLRCASVMKTSTTAEIRREVEERLSAIAEEMLIDAGDSARSKAQKVWKKLSVNPERLVPIHESVIRLVSQNHPELFPAQLGGDSWAYDFSGNTFAALPPDLHSALLQTRHRASLNSRNPNPKKNNTETDDNQLLWKLPPSGLAEMISFNLGTYGHPKFVDITEPDAPKFMTRPIDVSALGYTAQTGPTQTQPTAPKPPETVDGQARAVHSELAGYQTPQLAQPPTQSLMPVSANGSQDFVNSLPPRERVLFGGYLAKVVFPHLHGEAFPQNSNMNVYEVFDDLELKWYYRHWKKYADQGVNLGF